MKTIDYSKKENWCKLPQITKEVDTFYVYATEYIMGSRAEGAQGEYVLHASAYALFYNNIKANAAKRVAAYLANR